MSRDFRNDFLIPALHGLARKDAVRVGLALDCAIAFGALEAGSNESLKDRAAVEAAYNEKVKRLAGMGPKRWP